MIESVQTAFTGLMIKDPLMFHWLWQLDFKADDKIGTAAIAYGHNKGTLVVSPTYFNTLNAKQRIGLLIHELLHWIYRHPFYTQITDPLFNIAADIVVNRDVLKCSYAALGDGWVTIDSLRITHPYLFVNNPPPTLDAGTLEYLAWLKQGAKNEPKDYSPSLTSLGQGKHDHWKEVEPDDEHTVAQHIKDVMEKLTESQKAGKYQGYLEEILKALNPSQVRWQHILRRFTGYCGRSVQTPTVSQPNKYGGFPRFKLFPSNRIAYFVDTSGSMSNEAVMAGYSEMKAIHRQGTDILEGQFDWGVHEDTVRDFRPKDDFRIKGRGGTDFSETIKWLTAYKRKQMISGVVIHTDGYADWPSEKEIQNLNKPILWLITDNGPTPPSYCGQVVHIKSNAA